jgi:uncharacterized delta-60 repeat protein
MRVALVLVSLAATAGCNAVFSITQKELSDSGAQGFDLSVASSTVRVVRGQTASFSVSVLRKGGFGGPVSVLAAGVPDGVMVDSLELSPQDVEGPLTVHAPSSASLGASSLSVVATATGIPAQSSSLRLIVQDSPGSRDRTFGTDGRTAVPLAGGVLGIGPGGVKIAPDGSVVLCGWAGSSNADTSIAVARLTSGGVLDPTFGDGGIALARAMGSSADACYSMFLRAGGGINLAGFATPVATGIRATMVGRFTPAGIPDQNTGIGGFVTTSIDATDSAAYAILPGETDDTFLAGGVGGGQAVLERYQKYGKLDPNFGSSGTGIVSSGFGGDSLRSLAWQSSSNLIAAVDSSTFRVVRLTAAGEFDGSFGADGASLIDVGGLGSRAMVVLVPRPPMIQGNVILVVGTATDPGGTQDVAVARLTNSGQLDATFGGGGWNMAHFGGGDAVVTSATLGDDGAIVIAGQTPTDSGNAFSIVRFTPSGVLDATFGSGGRSTFSDGLAQSVYVDDLGRIVVAGTLAAQSGAGIAVYRLWP